MRAEVGDTMVVTSHHVGVPERTGEIVEVRGADGGPPFVVRWNDTGEQGLVFPGSDARVQQP
ncbi:MAG: DUF1918 domain-containing protein [Acidimicrobiales bacterium]